MWRWYQKSNKATSLSSGYPDNKATAPTFHQVEATTAPPALPANHVTGRNNNIEKVVESLSCQPSDMKEGWRVSLVIQFTPRREGRGNQRRPKQVGMNTKAVVMYCDQNQRHQNFDVPLLPALDQYCGHGLSSLSKLWYWKSLPPISTYGGIFTDEEKHRKDLLIFIYGNTTTVIYGV